VLFTSSCVLVELVAADGVGLQFEPEESAHSHSQWPTTDSEVYAMVHALAMGDLARRQAAGGSTGEVGEWGGHMPDSTEMLEEEQVVGGGGATEPWACAACTYVNIGGGEDECEVCLTPRNWTAESNV
jgi:hypothetical protein